MNKLPRMGSELGKDITPFVVLSSPATYRHQIFIHNNLEAPDELIAILDVLYQADEKDEVVIHLNSGGGAIHSLDTLLTAIESCPAHIHVIATGTIASAATFILLSSDSFELSPYASLLFHACSFGVYGESQDNLEFVQFVHKENERLMRDYYKHLFTDAEIEDIIVNKRQRWLSSEEFSVRFEAAKAKFEKEQEAQAKLDQENLAQMYAELDEMASEMHSLPEWIADKVTKKQLLQFINGEIEFDIDEETKKITVVPVDNTEEA